MTPLTRIQGYAHVAMRYGMEEAVFLDAIVHWYRVNRADGRNFYDGRWWTHNSVKAFDETFPWWSGKQVRRIVESCKEQGALLSANYNKDQRDRTIWYSPSDELLELYGDAETGNCICPNGQMQLPERADSFAQTGKALPCNTHVYTNTPYSPPQGDASAENSEKPKRTRRRRAAKSVPEWKPERFEGFWAAYPRDEERAKAVEQWDMLRTGDDQQDDDLLDEIARGLKRHLESEEWMSNIGIPHAWRWLRDRRWTEKQKRVRPMAATPPEREEDPWDGV